MMWQDISHSLLKYFFCFTADISDNILIRMADSIVFFISIEVHLQVS